MKTSLTQAQIDAKIAEARAKRPITEKINNSALLAGTDARIVHIRKNEAIQLQEGQEPLDQLLANRELTIAYKRHGNNIVEIATAITHSQDTFTKKIGTKLACEHFNAGQTVRVPINDKLNLVHQLRRMFV